MSIRLYDADPALSRESYAIVMGIVKLDACDAERIEMRDSEALAGLLCQALNTGDYDRFIYVVDYLFMTSRVSADTAAALKQLAEIDD